MFVDAVSFDAHRCNGRCMTEKDLRAQGFRRTKYERWQKPQEVGK
jgi:hypothetical protein